MESALDYLNAKFPVTVILQKEDIAMVGDNYQTDIRRHSIRHGYGDGINWDFQHVKTLEKWKNNQRTW